MKVSWLLGVFNAAPSSIYRLVRALPCPVVLLLYPRELRARFSLGRIRGNDYLHCIELRILVVAVVLVSRQACFSVSVCLWVVTVLARVPCQLDVDMLVVCNIGGTRVK